MNEFHTIAILLAAFLAVFAQTSFGGLREILGAQVDLLPALVVYASLRSGLITLGLLSVLGGLWFDSLSANPAGVSVLPLLVCGLAIFRAREILLRDQTYAQFVLGCAASTAVPLFTLVSLFQLGEQPLVGWASLWQWGVMALLGGLCTPLVFALFNRIERALFYQVLKETSFRGDREIKRGRA